MNGRNYDKCIGCGFPIKQQVSGDWMHTSDFGMDKIPDFPHRALPAEGVVMVSEEEGV